MSSTPQPVPTEERFAGLERRTQRLSKALITVMLLIVIFVSALSIIFWRKMKATEDAQKDLQFNQFVTDYNNSTDFIQPTVDTIQFLRRGYSITLDKVEYSQNGLTLSGQIGNPTQLWVSSLALNFSARPYPYTVRKSWAAADSPFFWWQDEWSIGGAQATVGVLSPGTTTAFTVTIPNVKQTHDSIEIAVWFSGERYQYIGR